MRFGRLGALSVVVASLLAGDVAFAQGTPPAATDPSRAATRAAIANGAPGTAGGITGPLDPNPTYGPSGPVPGSGWEKTHQRPKIWSYDSDPIVAERPGKPGKFYDARTGDNRIRGTMNKDVAADAIERRGYYEPKKTVNLYDWTTGEKAVGINAGPFKDGRWTVAGNENFDGSKENGGRLSVDALRLSGQADAKVGVVTQGYGVQGNVALKGQATLVGINGEFAQKWGRGGPVEGGFTGKGQAYVGAEAYAIGTAEISTQRLTANGKIGAFAGAKAEGELSGEIGSQYVGSIKGTVKGEVSYGIGASAEGYFTVDWTTMTVKVGGRASAALGVGAGVGFDTEISVKPAVDWTVKQVKAAGTAIANGATVAANAVADGAKWVAKKLCFWCSDPPPPVSAPIPPQVQHRVAAQPPRHAPTLVAPPVAGTARQTGGGSSNADEAAGAGMARN